MIGFDLSSVLPLAAAWQVINFPPLTNQLTFVPSPCPTKYINNRQNISWFRLHTRSKKFVLWTRRPNYKIWRKSRVMMGSQRFIGYVSRFAPTTPLKWVTPPCNKPMTSRLFLTARRLRDVYSFWKTLSTVLAFFRIRKFCLSDKKSGLSP